ncbi:hypothetical protein [Clostridium sp. C2-6-12]|uniref:hypothetical protein n=1 Tax=Clostridium sp. C2-6-12 TaxID=2698832 RepID=UPI001370AD80|nr:hypothetical protein [Clostridium sp. C2-6-12]
MYKKTILTEIPDRRKVVERIPDEVRAWGKPTDLKNYEAIKEHIEYLKVVLKLDFERKQKELDELYFQKDVEVIPAIVTSRQMSCMDAVTRNVQENNIQGAFHELIDMIISNNQLYDKPIDIIERVLISNAIIQIETLLK